MSFKERLEQLYQMHARKNCGRCPHSDDYNAGAVAALRLAADRMDVDEAVAAKWSGELKVIVAGTLIAQAEKLRALASTIEGGT